MPTILSSTSYVYGDSTIMSINNGIDEYRWVKRLLMTMIGVAVLSSQAVFAQETSSAIRGVVTNEAGNPVAGALH